jgi:hypothetical protein
MPHEFDRAHFRIQYPPRAQPRFHASTAQSWPVDNCSERGFRYVVSAPAGAAPPTLPTVGEEVRGRIEFHDGATVAVAGVVVRHDGARVAVRIEGPGVPLPIIWAEQRYLRSRYPELHRHREA